MAALTLTEIWIYPIKSLGGIRLDRATVREKGLSSDRRWMLIDHAGVALTQRTHPTMALFKVTIDGEQLSITYTKDQKTVSSTEIRMSGTPPGKRITARIWDDDVQVQEVDPTISAWFSRHLRSTCKLVAFPEASPRPVDPRYSVHNEHVSLADAYPFLIIGQGSLNDLNKRLQEPVPMNRFRPNFVFTGGEAFIEDMWRDISIGNIRFVAVKKSDRCVLTTVNQDTAEKGQEPLRTLSAYRKVENKVYFGQNLIALDEGEVAVGDPVIPQ
jgi:uncharacterized protein